MAKDRINRNELADKLVETATGGSRCAGEPGKS
jgi:hypothetical protein